MSEDIFISIEPSDEDIMSVLKFSNEKNVYSSLSFWESYILGGWKVVKLCAYYRKKPVAILMGRYKKGRSGLTKTLRIGEGQGSFPVFISEFENNLSLRKEIFFEIIKCFESKILSGNKIGSVIWFAPDYIEKDEFDRFCYKGEELKILYMDLTKSSDEVWKNFNKKCRNVIRFAQKNNVLVRRHDNLDVLPIVRELLVVTDKRNKTYNSAKEIMNQICILFNEGVCDIWVAYHENEPLAVAIIYKSKKRVHFAYAGSNEDGMTLKANNLLQWEILQYYNGVGYSDYCMGGMAPQSNSVSGYGKFKLSFNPRVEKSRLFIKVNNHAVNIYFKALSPFR